MFVALRTIAMPALLWGLATLMVGSIAIGGDEPIVLDLRQNFVLPLQLPTAPAPSNGHGVTFSANVLREHSAVEWQVRLKSEQEKEYHNVLALASARLRLQLPEGVERTLHWNEGSHAVVSDFRPLEATLENEKSIRLESLGGRSSDGVMPFFQIATETGGVVLAIGWSGDWQAEFSLTSGGEVDVVAGLKRADFRLKANQEVRLPSILLMTYRGDRMQGVNQFRKLMLKQYSPQHVSAEQLMPVAASVHGMIGFNDTTEKNLIELADVIGDLRLPLDTFWLDAGWNEGGFPAAQGNRRVDPQRFPGGLTSVSAAAHRQGVRFLCWFEPERVMRDTAIFREHPEWLMRPVGTPPEYRYQENDGFYLFDLGNEAAREWMLESVSKQVRDYQIDIYRQDCNLYPSYFWGNPLTADGSASSEVEYVTGLYDFLDDLQERFPKLIIDGCASGGRRIDFEMMKRTVLLWRSDCTWGDVSSPRNMQAMTHGLSHWLPLHGLGAVGTDDISLRSGMGYCASYAIAYRSEADTQRLKKHLQRFLPVRHLFAADFYPLTAWSSDPAEWLAFQFHDTEAGSGIVQVFRGENSARGSISLKLSGLVDEASYEISDWDDDSQVVKTGKQLKAEGLEILQPSGREVAKVYQVRQLR